MKRIQLILISLLLGVVCINYNDDNPYDPDFVGKYFLDIKWDNLRDTLGAFIEYSVPFTVSGGDDTIRNVVCTDTIIDSALFAKSQQSCFNFYFVNDYNGLVSVHGYALNGTLVDTADSVVVVTPFRIDSIMPSVFGETFACLH